jgi:hypothetical protein
VSSGAWALVGVIVGTILGAVAQIVSDKVQRDRERTLLIRSERREAYTEVLAAASSAVLPLTVARRVMDRGTGPAKEVHAVMREDLITGGEAIDRLSTGVARVQLVAPEDTSLAALELHAAVMLFFVQEVTDVAAAEFAEKQYAFHQCARRDLR